MKWTEFIFSFFSCGRSPPAEADVEEDSAQKKWDRLHGLLLNLEESLLLPPSEVRPSSWELKCMIITFQNEKSVFSPRLIITFFKAEGILLCLWCDGGLLQGLMCVSLSLKVTDSSMRHSDGTTRRMMGTQTLKELQTHISHLRELGRTATDPDQVHTSVFCVDLY